jgi:hypothetical protein
MQISLITEPRREWELWRQDDGGNQYCVSAYATREEAERQARTYEERGHKQVYWVQQAKRRG